MCLILFSWDNHPKYKLIVAANRDEFYERPTKSLGLWEEHPEVIAGKDLSAGGTWLGINQNGKFTALTNYRDISSIKDNAPSRGDLTKKFLTENISAEQFYQEVHPTLESYNGFNILNGTPDHLTYFNNQEKTLVTVEPGVYGLSNAFLDTPWPKVSRAKQMFSELIDQNQIYEDDLINFMKDKTPAEDNELPETGLSYEMEKVVSSMFLASEKYGTCCTTVLLVDNDGNGKIIEQSYPVGGRSDERKVFTFKWS